MTYAKPRIPIPFMATPSSCCINNNQPLHTFPEVAYDDNCIPFINGNHNFQCLPEGTIKLAHHYNGENLGSVIPSLRKDQKAQREPLLTDSKITFQKALK